MMDRWRLPRRGVTPARRGRGVRTVFLSSGDRMLRLADRPARFFLVAGVLATAGLSGPVATRAATPATSQTSADDAAVEPPRLDGPKTVALPAPVDDVIPAGG